MIFGKDKTQELLNQQRNIAINEINIGLDNMSGGGASIYVIGMADLAEKLGLITHDECKWYSDTAIARHKEIQAQKKAEYEATRKANKERKQ